MGGRVLGARLNPAPVHRSREEKYHTVGLNHSGEIYLGGGGGVADVFVFVLCQSVAAVVVYFLCSQVGVVRASHYSLSFEASHLQQTINAWILAKP
jgi:hypothetical protein